MIKVAIALLLATTASVQVFAKETYLVSEQDCFGVALISKAAMMNRDQGVDLNSFIMKIKSPDRMNDVGYAAMYPTIEAAVKEAYRDPGTTTDLFSEQLRRCNKNIGNPPTY